MRNFTPRCTLRLAIALAATLATSVALAGSATAGTVGPPNCSVDIDKLIDCGDGQGFTDGPCVGWNASAFGPAEDIEVLWDIANTGDDNLLNCMVVDSNSNLLSGGSGPHNVPPITAIGTNTTCSDALDDQEPDTATITCDCATPELDETPRTATAMDSANFECQTPELNITKSCVPTGNYTGTPTIDFEIEVTNPGVSENPATLDDCEVDDVLLPGSCEIVDSPLPLLEFTEPVGTLDPEESYAFTLPDNIIDEISCNVATVTCTLRDSGGKQISENADDQCGPPPPLEGCRQAEKQLLKIKAEGKVKWKWKKGAATSKSDFGDPTTDTDYRVCLYDGVGGDQSPPACADIPAGNGWKEKKKGFKFKSKSGVDGITSIQLKEGEQGKAKIQVKGEGGAALPLTPTAVLQISNSEGQCWESRFSQFKKNDEKKVKAK